jgi:hypothetical protein
MPDQFDIAVRAYAVPRQRRQRRSDQEPPKRQPNIVIVFDTETTRDKTQQLNFGACRIYASNALLAHQNNPAITGYTLFQEILFYADNLPAREPQWFATLQEYARTHASAAPAASATTSGDGRRLLSLDEMLSQNPTVAARLSEYGASLPGEEAEHFVERVQALLVAERTMPGFQPLVLMSRSQFVEEVVFRLGAERDAAVVGFNLPFDLPRLALRATDTRNREGFSLILFEHAGKANKFRPRIQVQHQNPHMAFINFTKWAVGSDERGKLRWSSDKQHGRFIDGHTLAYALSGASHTLASACKAWSTAERKDDDYEPTGTVTEQEIDYCRKDVAATWSLFERLMEEYGRHPIDLPPERAYSPPSIGKAYLRGMGLTPPMQKWPKFPKDRLGQAMVAYHGPRIETRLRKEMAPVVTLDCTSEYPTVNVLMGVRRFRNAETLDIADCTEEAQALLDSITIDGCYDRNLWPRLACCYVQFEPHGDVVPTRARFDGTYWGEAVGELWLDTPLWYALADAVASKIETGRAPRLLSAWKLVPRGEQGALRSVLALGAVEVDPRTDDFSQVLIEERVRVRRERGGEALQQGLKTLDNSTDYGIHGELHRSTTATPVKLDVYGLRQFESETTHPEIPGEWFFPPFAATTTAAGRLLMAMLASEIRRRGGSYAFMDTDSAAIVATEDGGTIQGADGIARYALSWQEVEAIRRRFAALSPHNPEVITPLDLLKLERENFCALPEHDAQCRCRPLFAYSIASKRYALFNLDDTGRPVLRKSSEHGLGHLLNPLRPEETSLRGERDWAKQLWQFLLEQELGFEPPEPPWLDLPAMSLLSVSKPYLWHLFDGVNKGKDYSDQIKPANFLLAPHVKVNMAGQRLVPDGYDPLHFQLYAPADFDPRHWLELDYIDRYTGSHVGVTLDEHEPHRTRAVVQTYRDVLREYEIHPEFKANAPDGKPCRTYTRGELTRRSIRGGAIHHLGKQGNEAEERDAGVTVDEEEWQEEYPDEAAEREALKAKLSQFPQKAVAAEAGIDVSTVRRFERGERIAEAATIAAIRDAVERLSKSV